MAFGLAEEFIGVLQVFLETNLPAKLDDIDGDYADDIELENIAQTYRGIKSLTTIPDYPALFIVSPEQNVVPWQVYESEASVKTKPRVYIGIIVLDPDQETLQLRLYRYARAITELLLEGMGTASLDSWDIVGEFEIDTETGGPIQTADRGDETPFIGEVSVAVHGQKTETGAY